LRGLWVEQGGEAERHREVKISVAWRWVGEGDASRRVDWGGAVVEVRKVKSCDCQQKEQDDGARRRQIDGQRTDMIFQL